MDKLLKQLQRDFKRNPKKAGMLGLLFLVAGWFWLPLVLPKEEKKPVKSTAAAAVTPVVGATAPIAPAAAPTMTWQELVHALDVDPHMQSFVAPTTGGRRNPFSSQVAGFDYDAAFDQYVADVIAEQDEERTISPGEASPLLNAMPLALSSTIVGGRTPRAVINGRAFDLGATIGVRNDLPIVLTHIEVRRVIVEWNGSRRELRILRPGETPATAMGSTPLFQ